MGIPQKLFKRDRESVLLISKLLLFIPLATFHMVGNAQEPNKEITMNGLDQITPLQVGDAVPDELWNMSIQVINELEGKKSIKLSDYRKKKLILLDFLGYLVWQLYRKIR